MAARHASHFCPPLRLLVFYDLITRCAPQRVANLVMRNGIHVRKGSGNRLLPSPEATTESRPSDDVVTGGAARWLETTRSTKRWKPAWARSESRCGVPQRPAR